MKRKWQWINGNNSFLYNFKISKFCDCIKRNVLFNIVYIYKCPLKQVCLYTDILLLLNAIFLKFYRNSDRIDYFHGNLGFDECEFISYLMTMYIYCVYLALKQASFKMFSNTSSVTSSLILLPFLSVTQQESGSGWFNELGSWIT
jgi:hypothetical protein